MSRLVLMGSPYWCRYLQSELAREGVDAVHIPHGRQMLKVFSERQGKVIAVGYGTSLSMKRVAVWLTLFAWWLLHRRRGSIFLYWIGRDVTSAGTGTGSRLLIRMLGAVGARHLCGAPWFVGQLRSAGIAATPVLFPYNTDAAVKLVQPVLYPSPFRVLVYLTQGGWENMNGSMILDLASSTPDLRWSVVGMQSSQIPGGLQPPGNMAFLGWVSDPLPILAEHHAFVRIVGHDAYSGMVRDAQAMGKVVLYSKPVRGVIDISGMGLSQIADILARLSMESAEGRMKGTTNRTSTDLPTFRQQLAALVSALDLERSP